MPGSQDILKYGLLGGAAYLAYKWYSGTGTAAAPASTAAAFAVQASATSPAVTVTTPTVTTPAAPAVSPASLSAAAVAQGAGSMLNPDQWNWLVVNVLKQPALVLDAFGPVSQSTRTATYSASDFFAIATGSKPAPVPDNAGVNTGTTAAQQSSAAAVLTQQAGGAAVLNPDQWNYYAGSAYADLDTPFGPAGGTGRTSTITAQQFLDAIARAAMAGAPSYSMSGLGLIQSSRAPYTNPILRPNIPGKRRWIPVSQRPRVVLDTKGGWAV